MKKYKLSYADIFFSKFQEQLIFTEKNNRALIIQKSLSYIIYSLFKFYYIDNICSNENIINESITQIKNKKMNINKECQKYVDEINKDFSSILEEDIKNLEMEINEEANKEKKEYLSPGKIKTIIEENKIFERVNDIIDEIKNEKIAQLNDYGKYCIKQCSNLLEKKNFNYISRLVFLNFSEKYREQNSNSPNYNPFCYIRYAISPWLSCGGIQFYANILAISIFNLGIIYLPFVLYFSRNKYQISEIFDKIKLTIKDIQKQIILEFENQRDNFISNLSDVEQITENEILYFKQNKFHDNFAQLINFIKDNSC